LKILKYFKEIIIMVIFSVIIGWLLTYNFYYEISGLRYFFIIFCISITLTIFSFVSFSIIESFWDKIKLNRKRKEVSNIFMQ
jgi:hypothetical protein